LFNLIRTFAAFIGFLSLADRIAPLIDEI